jgi:hypothetical protein
VDNSLLTESATLACQKNLVYPDSPIKEAITHIHVVNPLELQEECSKKNSSRIGEKRKLGENASYFI